jgi:hypothetical protein
MERILIGWNFVRLFRLVLGIYITVQSVMTSEWILGVAGLFLTGMALWNLGCCGMYGCYPDIKSNPVSVKEIIYEEVDAQK